MVGRVLDLDKLLVPDQMGTRIAQYHISWETLRQEKVKQWEELRRYIYATDTRQTSNATLPWKNTTTVPKLCQIRDNLNANYMASIFPSVDGLCGKVALPIPRKKQKPSGLHVLCHRLRWFQRKRLPSLSLTTLTMVTALPL